MSGRQHSTESGPAPLREADRVAYDNDVILQRRAEEVGPGVTGSQWMQLYRAVGPERDPRPSDVAKLFDNAGSVLAPPKSAAAGRGRVATAAVAPRPAAPKQRPVSFGRVLSPEERAQSDLENKRAFAQGKHEGRMQWAETLPKGISTAVKGLERLRHAARHSKDTRHGQASELIKGWEKSSYTRHPWDGMS
jgi:hypothetical protein